VVLQSPPLMLDQASARTPQPRPSAADASRTLWDVVARQATANPEGLYLTLYDRPLTRGRLHATSLRYAGALAARGLGRGDKVALVLPTCEEFFFAFFGALAIGAVPVPLYPTLAPELKARIFRDAEAQVVVTVDWFREDVEAARAEAPAVRHSPCAIT
jgi:acyl-CoA synthetase (AMP-forming)/AMP-acid ligase II